MVWEKVQQVIGDQFRQNLMVEDNADLWRLTGVHRIKDGLQTRDWVIMDSRLDGMDEPGLAPSGSMGFTLSIASPILRVLLLA